MIQDQELCRKKRDDEFVSKSSPITKVYTVIYLKNYKWFKNFLIYHRLFLSQKIMNYTMFFLNYHALNFDHKLLTCTVKFIDCANEICVVHLCDKTENSTIISDFL